MIKEIRSALESWLEDVNPFPDTFIEWDHYDPNVKIVFLRIEGEWTLEMRKEVVEFLREHKKSVLVGRLITGEENYTRVLYD